MPCPIQAQQAVDSQSTPTLKGGLPAQLPDFTKRENIGSTLQLVMLLGVLSLAPAILLMVTSFTRIIIVLSLLRQALGAQQLPPNQVLIGLSLFMTFLVMTPTWKSMVNKRGAPAVYERSTRSENRLGQRHPGAVRDFISQQIDRAKNDGDVDVFTDAAKLPRARNWDEVPTTALKFARVHAE